MLDRKGCEPQDRLEKRKKKKEEEEITAWGFALEVDDVALSLTLKPELKKRAVPLAEAASAKAWRQKGTSRLEEWKMTPLGGAMGIAGREQGLSFAKNKVWVQTGVRRDWFLPSRCHMRSCAVKF